MFGSFYIQFVSIGYILSTKHTLEIHLHVILFIYSFTEYFLVTFSVYREMVGQGKKKKKMNKVVTIFVLKKLRNQPGTFPHTGLIILFWVPTTFFFCLFVCFNFSHNILSMSLPCCCCC